MHQARKLVGLARRDRVAVSHVQRIAGLPHVQARHGTPGAADHVERALPQRLHDRLARQRLAHDLLGLVEIVPGGVGEREPPEGKRHALPDLAAFDVDQFERAAAEIADDAVGAVNSGDDAERGKPRFLLARKHLDRHAAGGLGLSDERGTVLGLAHGGGGDRIDFFDLHHVAERPKAPQRAERLLDRVGRQPAFRSNLAAEAAENLLVEDRSGAADQPLVDDEADGVGADVDDGDRTNVRQPAVGFERRRFSRDRRGGRGSEEKSSLRDLPRPDRLGFVMK